MRFSGTGAALSASFQLAGELVSLCATEATGVMDRAERTRVMLSILERLVVAVENDEERLGKDNRSELSLMTLI
jgi:hypothetical protein